MSEGILPSNEGRGYVLRRIIRRASLHCHKLNDNEIILSKLLKSVINEYSKVYFNLPEAFSFIEKNLKNEEKNFQKLYQMDFNFSIKKLMPFKVMSFHLKWLLNYMIPMDFLLI